jgi:hypothetical protein
MHDSAWCIKQTKVLLGFTYTRSQTESRYNFGKDRGLARGKGKNKRVTPEFGERRKENSTPKIRGVTIKRMAR